MGKNKSVSKTRRAVSDLAEIAAYYGTESLELELRFIEAAETAFTRLARFPKKGARREFFHPNLKNVRVWPIAGFPKVLIFYLPDEAGIKIIRVLHSSRDLDALFGDSKSDETD